MKLTLEKKKKVIKQFYISIHKEQERVLSSVKTFRAAMEQYTNYPGIRCQTTQYGMNLHLYGDESYIKWG